MFPTQPVPTVVNPGSQAVQEDATLTANGSTVLSGFGAGSVTLVINVTDSPTGTTPTLQYTLQEVDPGDDTTLFGSSASSTVINAIGIETVTLSGIKGGSVKVSWVLTGGTPSFTGVYTTLGQGGASGGTSVDQGTAAALSGGWPVKVTDGVSVLGTGAAPVRVDPTGTTTQPVSLASVPLPSGAATAANQTTLGNQTTKINDGSNTAAVSAANALKVDGSAVTQPISAASLPLPTGAAQEHVTAGSPNAARLSDGAAFYDATKTGQLPAALSGGRLDVVVGAALPAGTNTIGDVGVLSVPAPLSTAGGGTEATALRVTVANDSTGLLSVDDNGASLTVDSPQLPAALVGARLDVNQGAWLGSTAPTVGSKTSANSVPVVVASDQGAIPVSGTVTVDFTGTVDAGNSSTAVLTGGATFTGTGADVLDIASIGIQVFASHASATDGLSLQWSQDNTNWDETLVFTISAALAQSYMVGPRARYFRVVYTNGATLQTTFRLQTILHPTIARHGQIRLASEPDGQQDATLVKAVLAGKTTAGGGAYVDVKVAPSGAVQVGGVVDQGTGAVATSAWAARLSDGAAFYDGTKTGQLPAALSGGRLDVVVGAALPAGTNNIGDVDVLSVPAPLSTAGGGTEATALRVTVANDSTGVLSVDDNGASLTVDTPQLPAALVSGRLDVVVGAALPAGTNNIGDVDILSVPAPLSTTGGGTEATALRVTVANDSTGVLSVDDNGSSLTVDSPQLPAALVGARLDVNAGAWLGSTAPTVGSKTSANSVPVVIASDQGAVAVSAASLPLPAGAATEATLATLLADATFTGRINTLGQKAMAASTPIVIASDQSAVPVSGTVTANIGTSGALALDATLTGGTQKAIIRGGAKGATTAADVTSTAEGVDHQAVDVQIYHGGSAVNPTAIRALTSSDVVTAAQGTAAALAGYWPVRVTDGTNTQPTGDAVARAVFEKITDGTNTAAVKAASTAAIATDPALVVAISPNNTVPVSAASLPLPSGAATAANQTTLGSQTSKINDGTNTAAVKAASTAVIATDPALVVAISPNNTVAVTVPAPLSTTGGGTEATALRVTVANDSTGVLSVDDNGSSLTVDSPQLPAALVGARLDVNAGAWLGSTAPTVGSKTSANSVPVVIASDQGAVPVSGTVTANIGTSGALALDATLTGGTQKAIVRGGAKGSTTAADVTSTASGANHQILDVAIYDAAGNQITTFGGGTQYTVDDAAPANPVAPSLVAQRDDQLSTVTPIEGDWTQVRASSKGALWVTIPDSNGDPITSFGGGQQYADGAARGTATGTLAMVDDGVNIQSALGDSSGRLVVAGAGVAGTPAGGVVSIQGVASGTVVPVADGGGSLTVDSTQLPAALVGGRLDVVVGAALPAGTNNIGDVDVLSVPAPLSTTGGGTEATALRVTIADDSTGLLSVDDNGASLTVDSTQLPAALVGARLDVNAGAWLGSTAPTVGSKTSANSVPVVIASDQGAVAVTVSGVATAANQTTLGSQTTKINDGTNTANVKAASVSAVAADPALVVTPRQAGTATLSNVGASVTSVTLLAANVARIGATVYNDSTALLYVKFGTTASTSSFTVRVASQGYYEVPFGYTGRIDGIWASANGSARVSEMT